MHSTMENDHRLPHRSLPVVAPLFLVLVTLCLARDSVASGTLKLLVNETNSSPMVAGMNTVFPYGSNNRTNESVPAGPRFRTGSLPKTFEADGTTFSIPSKTVTSPVATNTASTSVPQNSTTPPVPATAVTRSLRGPASDGTDEANATSFNKAFEEAYEKYLADYEAYLDAYYSVYAHPHAAHPAYAGHVVPHVKGLHGRLPFFQTPPAGYPDFPYVFGYPVIFNGAGMIT